MAPPSSASRKPITNPPMLDTTRDTRPRMIAATPAKTLVAFWNHIVRPSVTSSTPMISEPAPAVVDMVTDMVPSLSVAYGK
nr:hypothetical protein [Streptomyces sp. MH191]